MIKGNQAFKEQQWQKAISYYNEAIKLNDKNATYYSNRAAAYLELGRYFFILEHCCIGILLYLLDIFYFTFSFQHAEADCSNAINLDKKVISCYFLLVLSWIACYHYFSLTTMNFSLKLANLLRFALYI
jgi:tetratricopeptide (TPR) repeat protein